MKTSAAFRLTLVVLLLAVCLSAQNQAAHRDTHARAQSPAPRLLAPMGGGYSDIYAGFSAAAVANARNGQVNILVLPAPYSSNPLNITPGERSVNLRDAEERRFQLESACQRAAPPELICQARLLPVFTQADAADPAVLAQLSDDFSAVFILGGDQTVALQAIAGSPLEARLAELYQQGVIIAGTSAGAGMQSLTMLGGYAANAAAASALNFGSSDVWNTAERRGLSFGLPNAILDQHFFQRGRLGRLITAVARPDTPNLGLGVDAYTGVLIRDETNVESVFGLYTVTVLDAETYRAAQGVRYVGPANTLSLRNLLLHILATAAPEGAGEATYNLQSRQVAIAGLPVVPPAYLERDFDSLRLPPGAGALILAGDLTDNLADQPALKRRVELSGGASARLVIVAAGYPSDSAAKRQADRYAAALGVPAEILLVPTDPAAPIPALPAGVTGILFIGRDQSLLDPARLPDLKTAWLAGLPLLADNAAAALAGAYYAAHEPVPTEGEEQELAAQKSFFQGVTEIKPGLALLPVTLEPQTLDNNRWGRLFSLAYNHPDLLALALSRGGALEIGPQNALLLPGAPLVTLDLRAADLALGNNQTFIIANALLDIFAPGETLQPVPADIQANPPLQPTPALPTPAPTASASPTSAPTAAATLQPTHSLALPVAQGSAPTAQPTAAPLPTEAPAAEPAYPLPIGVGMLLGLGFLLLAFWLSKRKPR